MAGLGRRTHYRKHLTDSVLYDLPEPKQDERIAKVVATRGGNHFDIILASSKYSSSDTTSKHGNSSDDRTPQLAILPTKFHKLVWVKRNDFVIVQTGTDTTKQNGIMDDEDYAKEEEQKKSSNFVESDSSNTNSKSSNHKETGVRFIISHILYKDQVKHLREKKLWPENDSEFFDGGVDKRNRNATSVLDNNNSDTNVDRGDICGQHEDYKNNGDNYNNDDDNDGIVYNEYDDGNDDDLFVNTNRISRLEIQDSDDDYDPSSDEED